MEAKDTAIKIRKSVELPEDHSLLSMIDFADKVAEISFKIGKTVGVAESLQPALKAIKESHKAGRKEVVEWVGTNGGDRTGRIVGISKGRWQAQLKEWGIE